MHWIIWDGPATKLFRTVEIRAPFYPAFRWIRFMAAVDVVYSNLDHIISTDCILRAGRHCFLIQWKEFLSFIASLLSRSVQVLVVNSQYLPGILALCPVYSANFRAVRPIKFTERYTHKYIPLLYVPIFYFYTFLYALHLIDTWL